MTSQILIIYRIRKKNLEVTLLFLDFVHKRKMKQIFLINGHPKDIVTALILLSSNTKIKVHSPDGDTDFFDIATGVLLGDTLAPYISIICLNYLL